MKLEGPTAAGLMYSDTGSDGPVVVLLPPPPSPSAPCRSGGFPTTSSGAGSIRCATTTRCAATYLRTVPEPKLLLDRADQQRSFGGPVLIVWARHDKLMPPAPNLT